MFVAGCGTSGQSADTETDSPDSVDAIGVGDESSFDEDDVANGGDATDTSPDEETDDAPTDVEPELPECLSLNMACRVRGTSDAPSDSLTVDLEVTVDCVVTPTEAEQPAGVEYQWSLEPPLGSGAMLANSTGNENSFFVDSPGTYVARVEPVPSGEALTCEPVIMTATSAYPEALVVELTWDTPGARAPGAMGVSADLDLHLLRTGTSCWNSDVDDCHWRNKRPDWGVAGSAEDNPELSSSETGGPELLRYDTPHTGTYSVGVEYWDDRGLGVSNARVRIYLFGELVVEEERRLESEKDFWHVADIDWSALQITLVDEEYSNVGEASAECVP